MHRPVSAVPDFVHSRFGNLVPGLKHGFRCHRESTMMVHQLVKPSAQEEPQHLGDDIALTVFANEVASVTGE